jgi:hypothetical protein
LAGVGTTIYGGDVGYGTAITWTPFVDGGGVMKDSNDDFAASLLVTLAQYSAGHVAEFAMNIDTGRQTFTPGVHRSGGAINIAYGTAVTLNGEGDYALIAGSSLTTAADTKISLINGAKADDVLGAAATLGAKRC